ncbi:MAG: hypothetical protein AAF568_09215 [Pseudomonadota bacterium]
MIEWETAAILAIMLGLWAVSAWRQAQRRRRRKETLRRGEDGVYVWIEFDGSERRSETHPEEPGGAWYGDAGGDGGGDGGGD